MNSMKNIDIKEAAKICKVKHLTIRNWIKKGILANAFKATVIGKERWLIPYTDIPTFYREQYEHNKSS
jgi:predicted site-specific integrase-resolvase